MRKIGLNGQLVEIQMRICKKFVILGSNPVSKLNRIKCYSPAASSAPAMMGSGTAVESSRCEPEDVFPNGQDFRPHKTLSVSPGSRLKTDRKFSNVGSGTCGSNSSTEAQRLAKNLSKKLFMMPFKKLVEESVSEESKGLSSIQTPEVQKVESTM